MGSASFQVSISLVVVDVWGPWEGHVSMSLMQGASGFVHICVFGLTGIFRVLRVSNG